MKDQSEEIMYAVFVEDKDAHEFPIICELYNGYTTTTTILSEAQRECQEYRDIWPENKYWVVKITKVEE